ncbi:Gfo/Idh/MocA family oxidoreductase [bacterium]|nr:Gfo/Idh/MocA family oxidoreductase [bacterium]
MIRIGVIGAGHWGPNYVRNFRELDAAQMVAVADPRADARATLQQRFADLKLYEDYRELLAEGEIDGVVVATPASTHHEIGMACLQAGKHVLIEKPLANSAAAALELAQYPLADGQIFMVGHIFRFHPGINRVRELMYEGTLGTTRYLHCVRTNLGPVRKDVSVIWDLAPHDVSIALHLFNGMPARVSATMGYYLQNSPGDVAFITLTFPGGELVNIHVSWVDPQKRREVDVIGTNALVRFDDMNVGETVRIVQRALLEVPSYSTFGEFQLVTHAGESVIPFIPPKEPLKEQCMEFLKSIQTRQQPLSDVRDGYRICAILEAAEASARQDGAPVNIEAEV